jgi:hypothetical protein
MKRRDFLQQTASLALMSPFLSEAAKAQAASEKLWIFFDANGAWDPTFFCDPHANPEYVPYQENHILHAGNLTYAPKSTNGGLVVPYQVDASQFNLSAEQGPQDFFDTYKDSLRVINGVDTQTNAHSVGSRHIWSGIKNRAGSPALGALIAAIRNQDAPSQYPLAWLTTGGYDNPANLVPASRLGNTESLSMVADPNNFSIGTFVNAYAHHDAVREQIRQHQSLRDTRLTNSASLPKIKLAHEQLAVSRLGEAGIAQIFDFLNVIPAPYPAPYNEQNPPPANLIPPLVNEARVTLAAMQAGICCGANLSFRGFDTHDNHDSDHPDRLQELFNAIDYTIALSKTLMDTNGTLLWDRLVIVVGSDFGRTKYNPSAGKDHWPITSMMLMGKHIGAIAGGRQIGGTQTNPDISGVEALSVKDDQGEIVTVSDPAEGVRITPGHIHHALRALAGIQDHPYTAKYPVLAPEENPLPILG